MRHAVLLTPDAENDLEDIYNYIADHASVASAKHVLDRLMETAKTLVTFPERGSVPRELLALGSREHRQIFFKPYRLVYRVEAKHVEVYLIADGRRDMKSLLARRLLGG